MLAGFFSEISFVAMIYNIFFHNQIPFLVITGFY